MIRLRSLASAISPAGLVLPVILTALLGWQSISSITWEFDQAHRCAVDWEQAIVALEGGATEYNGNCVGLSIMPGQEIPEDFYRQVESTRRDFVAATERLTDDSWKTASNHVGGAALMLFALLVGAMISGSPLGSGIAAWSLSNGWTRTVWARSALALTGVAIASAFVIATAAAVLVIQLKVGAAGVAGAYPAPGVGFLGPLPGLILYGMVGLTAGLLTGKGEIGGMAAVAFAVADFMGASFYDLSPFFPSSWHQTVLGAEVSPLSEVQAIGLAGTTALALTTLAYWYMTRRRDVPDR